VRLHYNQHGPTSKTLSVASNRLVSKRTAEKQITKLRREAQQSILHFIGERLASPDNPRQLGKPLEGQKGGLWRHRVGDYRLICDIQDEKITLLMLQVGHRKDVYR
jgi:mRNA interferase RelE/StbE